MDTQPPRSETDPTLHDLPELRRIDRLRRERALAERFESGTTADGFEMWATCVACGADADAWRKHLHDRAPAGTDDGSARVRLAYPDACGVCGGCVVEVHAAIRRSWRR
jgi:hypothetical protein